MKNSFQKTIFILVCVLIISILYLSLRSQLFDHKDRFRFFKPLVSNAFDFIHHRGEGYYFYNSDLERWITKKDPVTGNHATVIDSVIVDIHYHDDFILAIRQPRTLTKSNNRTLYNFQNKCEYWILNKENDEVFGPLDIKGFLEMLGERKICLDCDINDIFSRSLGSPPHSVPDQCLITTNQ